jgi:hypothetical protein
MQLSADHADQSAPDISCNWQTSPDLRQSYVIMQVCSQDVIMHHYELSLAQVYAS